METEQWHFDKIRFDKNDKFRHLNKNLDPDFAFSQEIGFEFNICLFQPHGFRIWILKSRSGLGLIK